MSLSREPLVSVTIPYYNAAATLPEALASLVAQTYTHWECILIDDGSSDYAHTVVEQIADARCRTIRLPQNMGRGVARQVALDQARGELLCKLDADDWIYPAKIERQVAAMAALPDVALISTGIAVVDAKNDLVGVRARVPSRRRAKCANRCHGRCRRLSPMRRP